MKLLSPPRSEVAKFSAECDLHQIDTRRRALVARLKELSNQIQAERRAGDKDYMLELEEVQDQLNAQLADVALILRTSHKMKRDELYEAFLKEHGAEKPEKP